MAHKGSSPEEQLLNLIEKGDSNKSQGAKKKKNLPLLLLTCEDHCYPRLG